MSNRLAGESSPYLRQHAENPVDWYPWGEAALRRAREEDKPILLSLGYAACHWCHVMAHESFANPDIARLMNQYFINIKVDRQERPDLDELYQGALQMLGQGGGWPLEDLPAVAARLFAAHSDPLYDGLGQAPKFPNPAALLQHCLKMQEAG